MTAHWAAVTIAAAPFTIAAFFLWLDTHIARQQRPPVTPRQVWDAPDMWGRSHYADREREAADFSLWAAELESEEQQ